MIYKTQPQWRVKERERAENYVITETYSSNINPLQSTPLPLCVQKQLMDTIASLAPSHFTHTLNRIRSKSKECFMLNAKQKGWVLFSAYWLDMVATGWARRLIYQVTSVLHWHRNTFLCPFLTGTTCTLSDTLTKITGHSSCLKMTLEFHPCSSEVAKYPQLLKKDPYRLFCDKNGLIEDSEWIH